MAELKVSFIVPVYNAENFIRACLESMRDQTYAGFEIIIVNDGSRDSSETIILDFIRENPQMKIQYTSQQNRGPAAARNHAAQIACGRYIALLDADDQALPERLEKSIAAIEQSDEIGLVHANIYLIDAGGGDKGLLIRNDVKRQASFQNIITRQVHFACPTVMFRKSLFDIVGGFDESPSLKGGCEDRDFILRIAEVSQIVYVDEALARYRLSDGSLSANVQKMKSARKFLIRKHKQKIKEYGLQLLLKALSSVYEEAGEGYYRAGLRARSIMQFGLAYLLYPLKPAIVKRMIAAAFI